MTNWKPKRKQRNKTCTHISSLPCINVPDGSNLFFLLDTDKYSLDEVIDWMEAISVDLPKVNIALLPKDMCCGVTPITGKEYTVINNVLNRMKE